MALLDDLKKVYDAAYRAARTGNGEVMVCHYEETSLRTTWLEGRDAGLAQRDRDMKYAAHRAEIIERREILELKLVMMFGSEELRDEFIDYVKELIRDETAPRRDY